MAVAARQSKLANFTGTSTTLNFDVPVLQFSTIVVCASIFTGGGAATISAVSDDGEITYAVAFNGATYSVGGANRIVQWYAFNSPGGYTGVSITISASSDAAVTITELTGCTTTDPLDAFNSTTGSGTTPTVNVTAVAAATGIVGAFNHDGTDRTLTSGAGYAVAIEHEGGTSDMPIHVEFQAFASAGVKAVNGTIGTGSVTFGIGGAAYKADVGDTLFAQATM